MKEPEIIKAISECFRYCWEDHATDTGCYPPDIEASNSRTRISYRPSTWTERSAECASQEILEMAEKESQAKSRLIEHLQGENERLKKDLGDIAKAIHYPSCWDESTYRSLLDAIENMPFDCSECEKPRAIY